MKKFLRRIKSRINLPDTALGKIVKALGGLVGIGGAADVVLGTGLLFDLTGDTVTDVIIVIISGLLMYFTGKLPVPADQKNRIPE
jgi:hypothetical protein